MNGNETATEKHILNSNILSELVPLIDLRLFLVAGNVSFSYSLIELM